MEQRVWQVNVKDTSFDRAGITKDNAEAVCEYIWNGFEANASNVTVMQRGGEMSETPSLLVKDDGHGIPFSSLEDTFGAFLASNKVANGIRIKSQQNKGKGRFSYLAFAQSARWITAYADGNEKKQYAISMSAVQRHSFSTSDLQTINGDAACGTTVELPVSDSMDFGIFAFPQIKEKLLEEFAWYLYLNPDKRLLYCDNALDPSEYINDDISKKITVNIEEHSFEINLIVWKRRTKNSSKIYYMNNEGTLFQTENTSFNKNSAEFYHAVFVRSDFFTENLVYHDYDDNDLRIQGIPPEQRQVMRELKKTIHGVIEQAFRSFLVGKADKLFADMEKRNSLPRFSDDDLGRVQKKDFQQVVQGIYCVEPRIFHNLKPVQERSLLGFLNLLLCSDERESILSIIEGVVSLSTEQRKDFATILERSRLEHILEVMGLIQKRYDIVTELKKIVFDHARFANERDHIQKIIEHHYWLFGDQYSLITADKTIQTSLVQFEEMLRAAGTESMAVDEREQAKRMDIFLYTSRYTEVGTCEGLILELKAPSVKLTSDVYNQIDKYANIIRREPRFQSADRTWRFYSICSVVDDDVRIKYENFLQHGKKCLAGMVGNFEIYAMSWDDVFTSFDARYRFLLDKLRVDYEQTGKNDDTLGAAITRASIDELTQRLIDIQV